jgi:hypothetical protein
MKVFATSNPNSGSRAKTRNRETVQASRAYTPQRGTFQRIREGIQRVASAAGNAIRRRLH